MVARPAAEKSEPKIVTLDEPVVGTFVRRMEDEARGKPKEIPIEIVLVGRIIAVVVEI